MFKYVYQGGVTVEIFSAQGNDPVAKWKLTGSKPPITKVFDKEVKGFVYNLEGNSQTHKMQIPKDGKLPLGLNQRILVLQVNVPLSKDFSMELLVTDAGHLKRRLYLSTVNKELLATPLHAKIPLTTLKRNVWCNLSVDLASFSREMFGGAQFHSLDGITVSACCRLRRIFTMRAQPTDSTDAGLYSLRSEPREEIPKNLQFPADVPHVTLTVNMESAANLDAKRRALSLDCELTGSARTTSARTAQDPSHIAFGSKVAGHPPHTARKPSVSSQAREAKSENLSSPSGRSGSFQPRPPSDRSSADRAGSRRPRLHSSSRTRGNAPHLSRLEDECQHAATLQASEHPHGSSLPVHPQNCSFPGHPENSSLPVQPQSSSLPVHPQNSSFPGHPDNSSLPVQPQSSSLPVHPQNCSFPGHPENSSLPVQPQSSSLTGHPKNSSLPVQPQSSSLTGHPQNSSLTRQPLNSSLPVQPQTSRRSGQPTADQETHCNQSCSVEVLGVGESGQTPDSSDGRLLSAETDSGRDGDGDDNGDSGGDHQGDHQGDEEEVFMFSSRPHSARRGQYHSDLLQDLTFDVNSGERDGEGERKDARPEDDFVGSESEEDEAYSQFLLQRCAVHSTPVLRSTPVGGLPPPPASPTAQSQSRDSSAGQAAPQSSSINSKRAEPACLVPPRCLSPGGPRTRNRLDQCEGVRSQPDGDTGRQVSRSSLREIRPGDLLLHKVSGQKRSEPVGSISRDSQDGEENEEEAEEDEEERRMLASLCKEQEEEEGGVGDSELSASQLHQCNISLSLSSDDTSTWTQCMPVPVDQGQHYQKEMNPLLHSNPREWMDVLSPPIVQPSQQRSKGKGDCSSAAAAGPEGPENKENEEEEFLSLLYDPCLKCYFDPKSGKYYELA